MDSGNLFDIRALAALLKEKDGDGESDAETELSQKHQALNPGCIGPPPPTYQRSPAQVPGSSSSKNEKDKRSCEGNIRSPSEVDTPEENLKIPDISNDPRKRPEVQLHFKQDVATEDVYLGNFNATPCSASCAWFTVKIEMPGESDSSKFQLDLKENWIELRTPIYVLVYVLPHRINPRMGNAKWNPETAVLTLTLKIVRDLDAFNQGLF